MKALHGIRILDLTHMVSGPFMGMLLADMGAETIKVEPPGTGEGTRRLLEKDPANSLHGMGAYFLTLNRNKKSITLNLKDAAGLELFYDLVKTADIVLYNFSVGVPDKLKISYPYLSAINPRIITASITGFGETGPGKDRVAFDMVAQAMSGGMSITGHAGTPPVRYGVPIADLGGGMMGVIGVLAALQARHTTGRGQHVDISMLDTQISLMSYVAAMYFLSGYVPGQLGNAHFVHVPYNTYPTQDGYIILAILTDGFWQALVEMLDEPQLNTEENRTQPGRLKNQAQIDGRLSEIFQTNTQSYWMEKLEQARIPAAPVYNVAQAMNDIQVKARNMVVEVEHVQGGTMRMTGNPVKLSDTYEDTYTSPPMLGQHTEEILSDLLGKSSEEIAALRANGII